MKKLIMLILCLSLVGCSSKPSVGDLTYSGPDNVVQEEDTEYGKMYQCSVDDNMVIIFINKDSGTVEEMSEYFEYEDKGNWWYSEFEEEGIGGYDYRTDEYSVSFQWTNGLTDENKAYCEKFMESVKIK